MNDIEAMKRYLEALAVNKRKQQVDAFLAQVSHAALASAFAAEGGVLPRSSSSGEPRRESAATVATSSGIPTKLNNLRTGTADDSSDEDDDGAGSARGDPQFRNCRSFAGDGTGQHESAAAAGGVAGCNKASNANGGASHVETLVVTQGPIPTRLIHLNVVDSSKALLLPPVDKASRIDRETRSRRMLHKLKESGVLTSNDRTPGQLPATFQPGPHDVVLSGDDFAARKASGTQGPYRNAEFQKLIFCSVPTYQVAVECQCTQDIKRLVQTIVLTVSQQRGHFVAPILVPKATLRGVPPLWCEVSRNIAERFCLRELKIASIAKARVQQMTTLGAAGPMFATTTANAAAPQPQHKKTAPPERKQHQQQPQHQSLKAPPPPPAIAAAALQHAVQTRRPPLPQRGEALTKSSSFARRVTPPEIALPSQADLENGTASPPLPPPPAVDPLALLSEAAFRVDKADCSSISKRKNEYCANADCYGDADADSEEGPRSKQRRISVT